MIINIDKLLNPVKVTEPWTHYVVDDVLNYDFSNELKFIFDDDAYFQLIGEMTFFKSMILEKYDPIRLQTQHIDSTQVRVFWQIEPPHIEKEIHMDHSSKIWTCVIYCYGEDGTVLYDRDRQRHSQVEWKQNRAIIFSPGVDSHKGSAEPTWHQIVNTTPKHRRVITLNITSTNETMPVKTPTMSWRSKDKSNLQDLYKPIIT